MKEIFQFFMGALIVLLCVAVGFGFEIYRWHTFMEITHSHISFLKWVWLFGRN